MDSPRRSMTRSDPRKQELINSIHSRADSPYTDLESNYGCGDGGAEQWNVVPIERCMSCISKLGALSRSSTTATTPGVPCWEHACDRHSLSSGSDCSGWSQAVTKPPARPPKPNSLSPQKRAPSPPPPPSYDNYDVPRIPFPVAKPEEYYDTPRKIKECLSEAVRKPCGCVLRVKPPEQPSDRPCVCQRLLSCWNGQQEDVQALYATVDMSKKCSRTHNYANFQPGGAAVANYANMEFAQSLELYENAKQVALNAALCNKCGHPQGDYLMMEPAAAKKNQAPSGYIPMSPAIKQRLGKVLSSSNPNLAPSVDRTAKPSGSSMLQANVYQRKQLLDSTDNLEQRRRRSNSADSSSRCEDAEACTCSCTQSVVRRSSSVPCKSNRDSSSSNDSGVFELPRRVASLPRRSKSSDPLRDLSFQFQKAEGKSASAEAEVPVCPSESTSSATSDMSDYIETLSMSSHSSTEAPPPSCTLRPRSGNEYLTLQRLIAPVPEEHHN